MCRAPDAARRYEARLAAYVPWQVSPSFRSTPFPSFLIAEVSDTGSLPSFPLESDLGSEDMFVVLNKLKQRGEADLSTSALGIDLFAIERAGIQIFGRWSQTAGYLFQKAYGPNLSGARVPGAFPRRFPIFPSRPSADQRGVHSYWIERVPVLVPFSLHREAPRPDEARGRAKGTRPRARCVSRGDGASDEGRRGTGPSICEVTEKDVTCSPSPIIFRFF